MVDFPLFISNNNLEFGSDGIFSAPMPVSDQETEKELRVGVAKQRYDHYLNLLAKHHSISAMNHEVSKILSKMLDWHWRKFLEIRLFKQNYLVGQTDCVATKF